MRVSMGILKNEHGVFYVRWKVPAKLQEATATVTGASKSRQVWLKQSLRTKDAHEAKRLAPPVLEKFKRILADAEASIADRPLRAMLDEREIKRIADYFYAYQLADDEEYRREAGNLKRKASKASLVVWTRPVSSTRPPIRLAMHPSSDYLIG